ncbi:MAG: hypothetical protein AAF992_01830 [Bacteroidota bacterium]
MDTALKLKIDLDSGLSIPKEKAIQSLGQSGIVNQLTNDLKDKPLFYVWRLIALSEIPYAEHLNYTKNLIDLVYEKLATPFGFSLSGDEKMFLPCYNAMLVSALCRLGRAKDKEVENAIDWINTYQPMQRGVEVSVPNLRFDRFGGCFKRTPCYIGVAKSVIALFNYRVSTGDSNVKQKLEQGIEYLLEHQLIKRLSCDRPVTDHILDISFPETYHLNIVELIRFAGQANLLSDSRTSKAIGFLQQARTKDSGWKISYRYKADGYLVFDRGRKVGEWVTYIIGKAINDEATIK